MNASIARFFTLKYQISRSPKMGKCVALAESIITIVKLINSDLTDTKSF